MKEVFIVVKVIQENNGNGDWIEQRSIEECNSYEEALKAIQTHYETEGDYQIMKIYRK